ncbi:hypothetical protein cypCar_00020944 [Cyprinus carpio]|nr:hypothetical protein cypCar_00020944 [Cyprinus carpio]
MVGKCYVRGNDLTYDPTDYWQSDTYELCDFNYDQNLEGMCNMGISGGMTENDVYFGTPGSFVWQGTVHMKERDPNFDFAGDANEISFGKLGEDKLNIYIGWSGPFVSSLLALFELETLVAATLQQSLEISAAQYKSNYGYSVLEDIKLLDRSKYTVVTGAPRDNFRGSVILAEKQGLVLNPVMTIPGEQIGSYFGSCLAVTDLNNDDWNDLIVGAPFYFDRNKEEGGAVYIFMNENGSFQKKASLVLKGKKGSGFGFAVAAVGDINQDGFQDLLDKYIETLVLHFTQRQIESQLPASPLRGRRIWISVSVTLNTPVRDKLQPIVFTLNVSLNEQKAAAQQTLQSLDAFPVLSGQQTLTSKTEINFHKECGVDNTCSSNLQLKAKFADENYIPFPSQTMEFNSNIKKLVMMVNVTNMPDGGKQEAEDAHQATLSITIPPSLKYSGVRPLTGLGIECSADETVICDLGNPFKSNHKTSLIIIFETSGVTLYTKQIESQLQLSTISEQKDLDPVSVTLNVKNTVLTTFSLEKQVIDTTFSGSVIGESAMNSISDVGSPLEFVFRVHMQGEPLGDLGTLMIDFEWPYEVANGKWLLYLTEIVIKGALELHCVPPGKIVNPLNLTLSDRGTKRSKRAVESGYPQAEASVTVLAPRKVPHFLECSKMTARCVTFSCPLHNMSTQTEIRVRSRVWNSTLLEDYANALRVEVKGQATLRLLTDKPAIRMDNQTREFSVNIDPVLGEETPYEVPLWIIIVSAVAGILLLGIISLILWKCGFFKRAVYYRIMPKYHGVKVRKEERYNLAFQPEQETLGHQLDRNA